MEKDVCARSLLELSALWGKMAAQKKKIEELTRSPTEDLSARKRNVLDMKHTKVAMDSKIKLTEKVKILPAFVAESDGWQWYVREPWRILLSSRRLPRIGRLYFRSKKTVCKLACSSSNADRKRWVMVSLASKVRLIVWTLVWKTIRNRRKRQAGDFGHKMRNEFGAWLAKLDYEAQQTHFKTPKVMILENRCGQECSLKKLKRELISAVSGPVALKDDLENLLTRLGYGSIL